MRHNAGNFREESGAVKPPAGICEGGAEWPSHSTMIRPRRPAPRARVLWQSLIVIDHSDLVRRVWRPDPEYNIDVLLQPHPWRSWGR